MSLPTGTVYVDGVAVAMPSEIAVQAEPIVTSRRAIDGTLRQDWRATKRQLELSWDAITDAQLQDILTRLDPSTGPHTIQYPDTSGPVTITVGVPVVRFDAAAVVGGVRWLRGVRLQVEEV